MSALALGLRGVEPERDAGRPCLLDRLRPLGHHVGAPLGDGADGLDELLERLLGENVLHPVRPPPVVRRLDRLGERARLDAPADVPERFVFEPRQIEAFATQRGRDARELDVAHAVGHARGELAPLWRAVALAAQQLPELDARRIRRSHSLLHRGAAIALSGGGAEAGAVARRRSEYELGRDVDIRLVCCAHALHGRHREAVRRRIEPAVVAPLERRRQRDRLVCGAGDPRYHEADSVVVVRVRRAHLARQQHRVLREAEPLRDACRAVDGVVTRLERRGARHSEELAVASGVGDAANQHLRLARGGVGDDRHDDGGARRRRQLDRGHLEQTRRWTVWVEKANVSNLVGKGNLRCAPLEVWHLERASPCCCGVGVPCEKAHARRLRFRRDVDPPAMPRHAWRRRLDARGLRRRRLRRVEGERMVPASGQRVACRCIRRSEPLHFDLVDRRRLAPRLQQLRADLRRDRCRDARLRAAAIPLRAACRIPFAPTDNARGHNGRHVVGVEETPRLAVAVAVLPRLQRLHQRVVVLLERADRLLDEHGERGRAQPEEDVGQPPPVTAVCDLLRPLLLAAASDVLARRVGDEDRPPSRVDDLARVALVVPHACVVRRAVVDGEQPHAERRVRSLHHAGVLPHDDTVWERVIGEPPACARRHHPLRRRRALAPVGAAPRADACAAGARGQH